MSASVFTSPVSVRTRLISFRMRCSANSGLLPTKSRKSSLGTTRKRVVSSVFTEAERGPSSSTISPKYSPGPDSPSTTSLPSSLTKIFTRPDTMMYSESVRSPSLTTTVPFWNVRDTACFAKSRRSMTSRISSGEGPFGVRFSIGSAREPRLGQALDAEAGDAEQAAREELRLRLLREAVVHRRVLHPRHRGDVDLVELVAAEDDAGDVAHRHADAPLDRPVGRVAHQVPRDELRVPHAAFGVDGRAVGDALVVLERGEQSFVRRRPRRDVVVVLPDLALEGVGEIEGLVVGAPARPVGADDAVVDE